MSNGLKLLKDKEYVVYPVGEVLFTKGERCKSLYIIKSGQVGVFKERGNRLVPQSAINAGEIVGENLLFTDEFWDFTAIVIQRAEIARIKKEDILSLVDAGPKWVKSILFTLSQRYKSSLNILQEHNIVDDLLSSKFTISQEEEDQFMDAVIAHRSSL